MWWSMEHGGGDGQGAPPSPNLLLLLPHFPSSFSFSSPPTFTPPSSPPPLPPPPPPSPPLSPFPFGILGPKSWDINWWERNVATEYVGNCHFLRCRENSKGTQPTTTSYGGQGKKEAGNVQLARWNVRGHLDWSPHWKGQQVRVPVYSLSGTHSLSTCLAVTYSKNYILYHNPHMLLK